jgi:uncharacterized Zn finger protein (UPF0148 family)
MEIVCPGCDAAFEYTGQPSCPRCGFSDAQALEVAAEGHWIREWRGR